MGSVLEPEIRTKTGPERPLKAGAAHGTGTDRTPAHGGRTAGRGPGASRQIARGTCGRDFLSSLRLRPEGAKGPLRRDTAAPVSPEPNPARSKSRRHESKWPGHRWCGSRGGAPRGPGGPSPQETSRAPQHHERLVPRAPQNRRHSRSRVRRRDPGCEFSAPDSTAQVGK